MAALMIENLTKVFPGDVHAVRGASLAVRDGEYLVLVGPSGCGKTTILRTIAGLERATGGTIRIGDRVVNDVPPGQRDVAMIFQSDGVYPFFNVRENLAFSLRMRRKELGLDRAAIAARVRAVAAMLGIEDLLDRRPDVISGGQRRRVAMGRAIVRAPAVYLFDEPLSNLDTSLKARLRGELKLLHKRLGVTTIHVTHDQEEAMSLGDRLAVMSDGAIHQCAPAPEVYRSPIDRFVAGFVGAPRMNFVEGRLSATDENGMVFQATASELIPIEFAPRDAALAAADRDTVLGIRPEALHVTTDASEPPKGGFRATVRVVEPLGDRMDVILETRHGIRLTARTPARSDLKEDRDVHLTADASGVHLFETGERGRNLLPTPRTGA
jgi:multiple sugar transport system ATP-binding protein